MPAKSASVRTPAASKGQPITPGSPRLVDFSGTRHFAVIAITHSPTVVRLVTNDQSVAHATIEPLTKAVNTAACRTLFDAYSTHGDVANARPKSDWKPTKQRIADMVRKAALRDTAAAEAAVSDELLEELARDAMGLPTLARARETSAGMAGNGMKTACVHVIELPDDFRPNDLAQLGMSLAVLDSMCDLGWQTAEAHSTLSEAALPILGAHFIGADPRLLTQQCDSFLFRRVEIPRDAAHRGGPGGGIVGGDIELDEDDAGEHAFSPVTGTDPAASHQAVDGAATLRSPLGCPGGSPSAGSGFGGSRSGMGLPPGILGNSSVGTSGDIPATAGLHRGITGPKQRTAAIKRAMELIEAGAVKIGAVDGLGRTVLHWVADWASDLASRLAPTALRNTILFLLEAGSPVFLCDADGQTVLDLARGKDLAMAVLAEHCADLHGESKSEREMQRLEREEAARQGWSTAGRHQRPLPPLKAVLAEVPAPRCGQAAFSATRPDVLFVATGRRLVMHDLALGRFTPLLQSERSEADDGDAMLNASTRSSRMASLKSEPTARSMVSDDSSARLKRLALSSAGEEGGLGDDGETSSDGDDQGAGARFSASCRFIVLPFSEHTHGTTTRDVIVVSDGTIVGIDYATADATVVTVKSHIVFDVFGGDGEGACCRIHWTPKGPRDAEERDGPEPLPAGSPARVDRSSRVTRHLTNEDGANRTAKRNQPEQALPSVGERAQLLPYDNEAGVHAAAESESEGPSPERAVPSSSADHDAVGRGTAHQHHVDAEASGLADGASEAGTDALAPTEPPVGFAVFVADGRICAWPLEANFFRSQYATTPFATRLHHFADALDAAAVWQDAKDSLPEAELRDAWRERCPAVSACYAVGLDTIASAICEVDGIGVAVATAEGNAIIFDAETCLFQFHYNPRGHRLAAHRGEDGVAADDGKTLRVDSPTSRNASTRFAVGAASVTSFAAGGNSPTAQPFGGESVNRYPQPLSAADIATSLTAVQLGDAGAHALAWAGKSFYVDGVAKGGAGAPVLTVHEGENDTEAMAVASSHSLDPRGIFVARRGELCRVDVATGDVTRHFYFPLSSSELRHRRRHGDEVDLLSGAQRIVFSCDGSAMLRHNIVSQCCVVYATSDLQREVRRLTHSSLTERKRVFCGPGLPRPADSVHSIPRERLVSFLSSITSQNGTAQQRVDHCHYVISALAAADAALAAKEAHTRPQSAATTATRSSAALALTTNTTGAANATSASDGAGAFTVWSPDADGRMPLHVVAASAYHRDMPDEALRGMLQYLLGKNAGLYEVPNRGQRPMLTLGTSNVARDLLAQHVKAQVETFPTAETAVIPRDGAAALDGVWRSQIGRCGRVYFCRNHTLTVRMPMSGKEHAIAPLRVGKRDVGFAMIPAFSSVAVVGGGVGDSDESAPVSAADSLTSRPTPMASAAAAASAKTLKDHQPNFTLEQPPAHAIPAASFTTSLPAGSATVSAAGDSPKQWADALPENTDVVLLDDGTLVACHWTQSGLEDEGRPSVATKAVPNLANEFFVQNGECPRQLTPLVRQRPQPRLRGEASVEVGSWGYGSPAHSPGAAFLAPNRSGGPLQRGASGLLAVNTFTGGTSGAPSPAGLGHLSPFMAGLSQPASARNGVSGSPGMGLKSAASMASMLNLENVAPYVAGLALSLDSGPAVGTVNDGGGIMAASPWAGTPPGSPDFDDASSAAADPPVRATVTPVVLDAVGLAMLDDAARGSALFGADVVLHAMLRALAWTTWADGAASGLSGELSNSDKDRVVATPPPPSLPPPCTPSALVVGSVQGAGTHTDRETLSTVFTVTVSRRDMPVRALVLHCDSIGYAAPWLGESASLDADLTDSERTHALRRAYGSWCGLSLPRVSTLRMDNNATCRPTLFRRRAGGSWSCAIAMGGPTLAVVTVDVERLKRAGLTNGDARARLVTYVDAPDGEANAEMSPCVWLKDPTRAPMGGVTPSAFGGPPTPGTNSVDARGAQHHSPPMLVALREGHLLVADPLVQRRVQVVQPLWVSTAEQEHLVEQGDVSATTTATLAGGSHQLLCTDDGECLLRQSRVHPSLVVYNRLPAALRETAGPLADVPGGLSIRHLADDSNEVTLETVAYPRPPRTALLRGSLSSLSFFFAGKDEQLGHLESIRAAIDKGRANPNQKDADGRTPFHVLATVLPHMKDNEAMDWVAKLAGSCCNPHLANNQGVTAFQQSERLRTLLRDYTIANPVVANAVAVQPKLITAAAAADRPATEGAASSLGGTGSPALEALAVASCATDPRGPGSVSSPSDAAVALNSSRTHGGAKGGAASLARAFGGREGGGPPVSTLLWSPTVETAAYAVLADGSVLLLGVGAASTTTQLLGPSRAREFRPDRPVAAHITAMRDRKTLAELKHRGNVPPEDRPASTRPLADLTFDLCLVPSDMILFSCGTAVAVRDPNGEQEAVEFLALADDESADDHARLQRQSATPATANAKRPKGLAWFICDAPKHPVLGQCQTCLPNPAATGIACQWYEVSYTAPHKPVAAIACAERNGALALRRLFTPPGLTAVFPRHWAVMVSRAEPFRVLVPRINASVPTPADTDGGPIVRILGGSCDSADAGSDCSDADSPAADDAATDENTDVPPAIDAYGISVVPGLGAVVTCGRYSDDLLLFDAETFAPVMHWSIAEQLPAIKFGGYGVQPVTCIPTPDQSTAPERLRPWRRPRTVTLGPLSHTCLVATEEGLSVLRIRRKRRGATGGGGGGGGGELTSPVHNASASHSVRDAALPSYEILPVLRATASESDPMRFGTVGSTSAAAEVPGHGTVLYPQSGALFRFGHSDGRLTVLDAGCCPSSVLDRLAEAESESSAGATHRIGVPREAQLSFSLSGKLFAVFLPSAGGFAVFSTRASGALARWKPPPPPSSPAGFTVLQTASSFQLGPKTPTVASGATPSPSLMTGNTAGVAGARQLMQYPSMTTAASQARGGPDASSAGKPAFFFNAAVGRGIGGMDSADDGCAWYLKRQPVGQIFELVRDYAARCAAGDPNPSGFSAVVKEHPLAVRAFETMFDRLCDAVAMRGTAPSSVADADGRNALHYAGLALLLHHLLPADGGKAAAGTGSPHKNRAPARSLLAEARDEDTHQALLDVGFTFAAHRGVVLAAIHRLVMVGVPCFAADRYQRAAFTDVNAVFAAAADDTANNGGAGTMDRGLREAALDLRETLLVARSAVLSSGRAALTPSAIDAAPVFEVAGADNGGDALSDLRGLHWCADRAGIVSHAAFGTAMHTVRWRAFEKGSVTAVAEDIDLRSVLLQEGQDMHVALLRMRGCATSLLLLPDGSIVDPELHQRAKVTAPDVDGDADRAGSSHAESISVFRSESPLGGFDAASFTHCPDGAGLLAIVPTRSGHRAGATAVRVLSAAVPEGLADPMDGVHLVLAAVGGSGDVTLTLRWGGEDADADLAATEAGHHGANSGSSGGNLAASASTANAASARFGGVGAHEQSLILQHRKHVDLFDDDSDDADGTENSSSPVAPTAAPTAVAFATLEDLEAHCRDVATVASVSVLRDGSVLAGLVAEDWFEVQHLQRIQHSSIDTLSPLDSTNGVGETVFGPATVVCRYQLPALWLKQARRHMPGVALEVSESGSAVCFLAPRARPNDAAIHRRAVVWSRATKRVIADVHVPDSAAWVGLSALPDGLGFAASFAAAPAAPMAADGASDSDGDVALVDAAAKTAGFVWIAVDGRALWCPWCRVGGSDAVGHVRLLDTYSDSNNGAPEGGGFVAEVAQAPKSKAEGDEAAKRVWRYVRVRAEDLVDAARENAGSRGGRCPVNWFC